MLTLLPELIPIICDYDQLTAIVLCHTCKTLRAHIPKIKVDTLLNSISSNPVMMKHVLPIQYASKYASMANLPPAGVMELINHYQFGKPLSPIVDIFLNITNNELKHGMALVYKSCSVTIESEDDLDEAYFRDFRNAVYGEFKVINKCAPYILTRLIKKFNNFCMCVGAYNLIAECNADDYLTYLQSYEYCKYLLQSNKITEVVRKLLYSDTKLDKRDILNILAGGPLEWLSLLLSDYNIAYECGIRYNNWFNRFNYHFTLALETHNANNNIISLLTHDSFVWNPPEPFCTRTINILLRVPDLPVEKLAMTKKWITFVEYSIGDILKSNGNSSQAKKTILTNYIRLGCNIMMIGKCKVENGANVVQIMLDNGREIPNPSDFKDDWALWLKYQFLQYHYNRLLNIS